MSPELARSVTVVSHSTIAALPHESMQQLIWHQGPKKIKYDLVATALQSISAVQEDEQALDIAWESHNHGKHGWAPPCNINHAKSTQ